MTGEGVWLQLTGDGALTLTVEPGYGAYVDDVIGTRDLSLVLCEECAGWLRRELPGLDGLLIRLAPPSGP